MQQMWFLLNFVESSALTGGTVCPFFIFIFFSVGGLLILLSCLSKCFSSIRANSNLMEQVVA